MKKFKPVLLYPLAVIGLILHVIINAVNLNPFYYEGAIFFAMSLSLFIVIFVITKLGSIQLVKVEPNQVKIRFGNNEKLPKMAVISLVIVWGLVIVMGIFSTVLFNVNKYKEQMPEAQAQEFTKDIQPVDISQIPIVDQNMAYQLADKKLGERQSLGSQVYVGTPTIQMVNKELVWAVPLHHSGFFKWLTNMSGTPGYIVVSATNTQKVEYVEGYKIKYQPNSYLFDDLTRHTRLTSALFKGITDYSFELDDTGQPYWVVSTYKNKAGFALPEADGIIVVNASTGESNTYGLDSVPEWVDRVQPEEFIINQINNKGEYIRGIFNFSNKDKYKTSQGHIIVYNNGRCYLFTGLTSVGADESAIGFMMVDMVTKEPKLYQLSGATESAAQKSAQGNVQQFGYRASFPLILNVDGTPSYFMTLKDTGGLIKQYALVSVKDYLLVGVGETVDATFNEYRKILRNNGVGNQVSQTSNLIEVTGKVVRIAGESDNTTTVYKLIIDQKAEIIFTAATSVNPEVSLTKDGDTVKISYYEGQSGVVPVQSFDNLMFNQ